jgi:hypothetical protein
MDSLPVKLGVPPTNPSTENFHSLEGLVCRVHQKKQGLFLKPLLRFIEKKDGSLYAVKAIE